MASLTRSSYPNKGLRCEYRKRLVNGLAVQGQQMLKYQA
jgi:hypothetical protein